MNNNSFNIENVKYCNVQLFALIEDNIKKKLQPKVDFLR